MDEYITIKEIAEKWNLTPRRIQKLCVDGKIPGARKFGRDWAIPSNADKPKDGRLRSGKYRSWRNETNIEKRNS